VPDDDAPLVHRARVLHAPGLELVHYPCLTHGWRSVPETYTCFTMIESLKGDVEMISRGVRAPGEAGSLTVGQPGEPLVLRASSAMRGEFRILRLSNHLYDELREELGTRSERSPFPRGPQRDPALALAFARLHPAIGRGEGLETQERLLALLAALVARGRRALAPGSGRDAPGVRRARELLHARFDASVSLDELALAAGMTDRFALLRAFKRELGTTPHAYQVQLRMVRACQFISQGTPLAAVALAVGYSEQSALNRVFKRVVGVTPAAYARTACS
jgi:AraC-like DNA-binding protein